MPHKPERIDYAGLTGSFATIVCVCGWSSSPRPTADPLWLEVLRADLREHAEQEPPDQWRCTWERLQRLPLGGAELADCDEPALPDSEPPRCYQHLGRP